VLRRLRRIGRFKVALGGAQGKRCCFAGATVAQTAGFGGRRYVAGATVFRDLDDNGVLIPWPNVFDRDRGWSSQAYS